MISRVDEPRQLYGLGSFVRKITKPIKKIVKSPIGKAAMLGAGLYGLNKFGLAGLGKGKLGSMFGTARDWAMANKGKAALLGLGAAGVTAPFLGGEEEEEVIETPWDVTPDSISNIYQMAKDRHPSLRFLPQSDYVQSGFFTGAKDGGLIGLANGGQPAQAQAEQMLKMEYQKYRNQGGTMSYQQFKMQVLKQAQGRGPVAQQQAQPQMMSQGGRSGYRLGELVEDQESVLMTPQGDEVVTDQMEEIEGQTAGPDWFTQLVEHFMYLGYNYDEASDMAWDVGHGKMELGDVPEKKAKGGRVGLLGGGPVPGSTVPGYTTPVGYNKFDYRTGGVPVRVGAANGGIMPLLDLKGKEKDYRQDGGFVGIGRKERADDVPARLSKNEFVFTADAVRNAGGGDVDAGAEVMDNMMKHLEAGGQISEESQGLGAQGMYDNMRQLKTRIA